MDSIYAHRNKLTVLEQHVSESERYSLFKEKLEERKKEHRLRTLACFHKRDGSRLISRGDKSCLNFCSNDYLGLSTSTYLSERASEYAEIYGTGAAASRLVSGTMEIHEKLEKRISTLFGKESALLFASGYQANTTVIPALAGKQDLILADKHVHNSILQGIRLSRSKFQRFRHNDTGHLRQLLQKASSESYRSVWVITESLFSMDGDKAPLAGISELCKDYHAYLYVDDAHALGVFGAKGMGLASEIGGVDVILTTFGKAAGCFGAAVICPDVIRQWLVNYCGGFIYSTALPPPVIGAVDASLDLIPQMDPERIELHEHSKEVIESLGAIGYNTGSSNSQIIPVLMPSEKAAVHLAEKLLEHSIFVQAIRPPTVQKSRLRITLTALHTRGESQRLIETFNSNE